MKAENFGSLVDELRHIVDHHGVEETKKLWMSDREQLDAIHVEAHRLESRMTIEGVTRWLRSCDDSPCICCDGPHVFRYKIDLIDAPVSRWHPNQARGIDEWAYDAICSAPEGTRLRFIVEVIDEP